MDHNLPLIGRHPLNIVQIIHTVAQTPTRANLVSQDFQCSRLGTDTRNAVTTTKSRIKWTKTTKRLLRLSLKVE